MREGRGLGCYTKLWHLPFWCFKGNASGEFFVAASIITEVVFVIRLQNE
jgi:hypothetical protein